MWGGGYNNYNYPHGHCPVNGGYPPPQSYLQAGGHSHGHYPVNGGYPQGYMHPSGSVGVGGMLGGYGGHQAYGHSHGHGGYTHGGGGYAMMHDGGGHYGHGKFGKDGKFGKMHGYRKWK